MEVSYAIGNRDAVWVEDEFVIRYEVLDVVTIGLRDEFGREDAARCSQKVVLDHLRMYHESLLAVSDYDSPVCQPHHPGEI